MRFPDVLIIGAMKSGTTSLYMDLAQHPRVFRAEDKEPQCLCHDAVLEPAEQARYAGLYAAAAAEELLIDASTYYTKRPDYEGIAARAVQVLPVGFRVIYVVRHPIERIVSQHHHEFSAGDVGPDIDQVVRTCPHFLNYSRYAYQLEPWRAAVGRERIKIVFFEDYLTRRGEVLTQLWQFLGLDPLEVISSKPPAYNVSQGKPVANRFWQSIRHQPAYRETVRPLLPIEFRQKLRRLVLPHAPPRPQPPTAETLAWLSAQLAPEVARLQEEWEISVPWKSFFFEGITENTERK